MPITRWPKTVQQRSFEISFLHFLLCHRCRGSRRRPFATAFGNSFLQFVFPTFFNFLQPKFTLPFATPVCDSFVRLLFITSFCSSCLQLHFEAPVCNSFCSSCLQLLCGTSVCNSFSKILLAGPLFDLTFLCPLLMLLLLLSLLLSSLLL